MLGGNVAVSEERRFDPANVQVAKYDTLAVADFSNVQYLEVTDSEAENGDEEEEGEDLEGDDAEDGLPKPSKGKSPSAGNADDDGPPMMTPATSTQRKKDKRKNKKGKLSIESGMCAPFTVTLLHGRCVTDSNP